MSLLRKLSLVVGVTTLFSGLLVPGGIVFARTQTPKIPYGSGIVSNSFTDGVWSGTITVSRLTDGTYQVQASCTVDELLPWPHFTNSDGKLAFADPLNYGLGCNAGQNSELITISPPPAYTYNQYYNPTPLTYGITYANPIVTEGPFSGGATLLAHQTQDQQWCVGIDTFSSVWAFDSDNKTETYSASNNSDFACVNSQDATLSPIPAGYLSNAGGSMVSGWACDNNNGSATSNVDIYANAPYLQSGSVFLGTTTADINRPDLVSAGVCGGTPKHGFQFDARVAGNGYHRIWAYNVVNGTFTTIGNSGTIAVSIGAPYPVGYFQNQSGSILTGWACDDTNVTNISDVDFYADGAFNQGGRYIGSAHSGDNHPDLVGAGVCGSTPNHGFTFDAKNAGSGQHKIWAYNQVSGTVTLLGNSGNVIDNGIPPVPDGWMVSDGAYTLSGWACDDAFGAATSTIDFYINAPYRQPGSVYLGSTNATIYRPDVASANKCGSTPSHGFTFDASVGSNPNGYPVWAYNKVSGTVTLLGNSGNVTVTDYTGGCHPLRCNVATHNPTA